MLLPVTEIEILSFCQENKSKNSYDWIKEWNKGANRSHIEIALGNYILRFQ